MNRQKWIRPLEFNWSKRRGPFEDKPHADQYEEISQITPLGGQEREADRAHRRAGKNEVVPAYCPDCIVIDGRMNEAVFGRISPVQVEK
jgi:hypothetical protein